MACIILAVTMTVSMWEGSFSPVLMQLIKPSISFWNIIGGVDRPTSGKVFINGTDIHALKEDKLAIFRRRQIGLIYQFYNLLPVLNVDENIMLPHLLDGHPCDRERLDLIVQEMGLTDRRYNLPNQLSGGQQIFICGSSPRHSEIRKSNTG